MFVFTFQDVILTLMLGFVAVVVGSVLSARRK